MDGPTARQCGTCYFGRQMAGRLCCAHGPPAADGRTGRARWPRVAATDTCGRFRYADGATIETDPWPRNALPVHADRCGDYCKIPLTQGRFARVDPADYLWLSQFRWCCKVGLNTCYAIRHVQTAGRSRRIYMHRQIMDTPHGLICDHVNHDGLDNRRANLRNCTVAQNNANRRSSPNATSSYIGVSYCRKRRKWVSYIKHYGRSRFLGQFDRPQDAARAHDHAAWSLHGEYANLNFPQDYPTHPAAKPHSDK